MPTFHILTLVALTSLAAYGLARRVLRLPTRGLKRAVGEALESVGMIVLFYLGNLALGLTLALIARAAGRFVSLYVFSDPTLALLSLLQALVFRHWHDKETD